MFCLTILGHLISEKKDIAYRTFQKKKKLFEGAHITFVACSRWLESLAKKSDLIKGQTITNIPNAINTNLFRPRPKATARERLHLPADKKLLLFGSMKITDERKGIAYLIEACQLLAQKEPEFSRQLSSSSSLLALRSITRAPAMK